MTELFNNKCGIIYADDNHPDVRAFCPIDDKGRNDDCIYYFRLRDGLIWQCGWNYGRGKFLDQFIYNDAAWTISPEDSELNTEYHTPAYQSWLMARLHQCLLYNM